MKCREIIYFCFRTYLQTVYYLTGYCKLHIDIADHNCERILASKVDNGNRMNIEVDLALYKGQSKIIRTYNFFEQTQE